MRDIHDTHDINPLSNLYVRTSPLTYNRFERVKVKQYSERILVR